MLHLDMACLWLTVIALAAGKMPANSSRAFEKGLRGEAQQAEAQQAEAQQAEAQQAEPQQAEAQQAATSSQAFGASILAAMKSVKLFGSSHGGNCRKPWQDNPAFNGTCPYGRKLPGDVTWPEYHRAAAMNLEAPYALPLGLPSNFFLKFSVAYSFIPYIFALVIIVKSLTRRGTRELSFLGFLGFLIGSNEVFVKPFMMEPRPALSCLLSCGMPSSHAAIAIGTVTMAMGHSFFRTAPVQIAAILQMESDGAAEESAHHGRSVRQTCKHLLQEVMAGLPFDEPSQEQVTIASVTWICLLLPVPICRIIIADHTPGQVFVGGVMGGVCAIIWSLFKRKFERRFQSSIGKEWWCCRHRLLTHNLALPCYSALLDITADARSGLVDNKDAVIRQLQWYEFETLYKIRHVHGQTAAEDDHERYLKFRWCLLRDFMDKIDPEAKTALDLAHAVQHRQHYTESQFMDSVQAYWSWVPLKNRSKTQLDFWTSLGVLQGTWLQVRHALSDPASYSPTSEALHLRNNYLGGHEKDASIAKLEKKCEQMQSRLTEEFEKLQSVAEEQLSISKRHTQKRRSRIQDDMSRLTLQSCAAKDLENPEERAAALEKLVEKLQGELEATNNQLEEEDDRHLEELGEVVQQHRVSWEQSTSQRHSEQLRLQSLVVEMKEYVQELHKEHTTMQRPVSSVSMSQSLSSFRASSATLHSGDSSMPLGVHESIRQQSSARSVRSHLPSFHNLKFMSNSSAERDVEITSRPPTNSWPSGHKRPSLPLSSSQTLLQTPVIHGRWNWGTELVIQVDVGEAGSRCMRYKAQVTSSSQQYLAGREIALVVTADSQVRLEFETEELLREWPHALEGRINADVSRIVWAFGATSLLKESAERRGASTKEARRKSWASETWYRS